MSSLKEQHHAEPSCATQPLALQEILSALTFALDLTEGAVPGHALRCVLLGMRMGEALDLPEEMLKSLYYALQLKDVGCSSNSARVAQMFAGDDRQAKALSKLTDWSGLLRPAGSRLGDRLVDWTRTLRTVPRHASTLWHLVQPDGSVRGKLKRMADLGRHAEKNMQEVLSLRCDRGAYIMGKLEMTPMACEAVRGLDEHWDGSGYPEGLAGDRIPLLSRICAVAQHLDVFARARGPEAAVSALARRRGTWFDPALVRLVDRLHRSEKFWADCGPGRTVDETRTAAMRMSPETAVALPADRIDTISEAFADVVDAKSPFTFRHSVGVMRTAVALAGELGLPEERVQTIRRAALLHDLGKLGVPNSILDKPGRLTDEERAVVFDHPLLSQAILERISGFGEIARIAGEHHERLDGRGYPRGLKAEQLSLESRLLSVADVFAALAEDRPYRERIPLDHVRRMLSDQTPEQLDATVVEALDGVLASWNERLDGVFLGPEAATYCGRPMPTVALGEWVAAD